MKTIKILIVLSFFSVSLFAQKIDEKRMKRDIEVAEQVLGTLLYEDKGRGFFMETIEGTYVEDYGVIITLPNRFHNGIYGTAASFSYSGTGNENVVFYRSDDESAVTVNVPKIEVKSVDIDSLQNVKNEKILEAIKTFFADYGNLISQLQPDNRILITNKKENFQWRGPNKQTGAFSAEIKVGQINAYKAGKTNRQEFLKQIKVLKETSKEENPQDLVLLSSIMQRLYRSDLSNTYYVNGSINFDLLSDFGVVFHMKVYSSSGSNDIHTIVTRHQDNVTQQERDAIVKTMYPEFLASLKENILDYGRTLNSLKSDEMLMFKVEMTKCIGCNLPKVVEVSLKNAVLQEYAAGKISKEEALKKFNVREGDLQ